jgi:hypothetical protein
MERFRPRDFRESDSSSFQYDFLKEPLCFFMEPIQTLTN